MKFYNLITLRNKGGFNMLKIAKQPEIGKYISKLVNSKFKSQRAFCRAWLREENIEENDDEIRKKANKYSQIKIGRKGIQIEDLPVFCSLLDTSCEEILSAGRSFKPRSERLTNYTVALSSNKKIWDKYIHHNDNLILNADEYGNTVLDYAIRFKNLKFIEYLISEGYIWFDGKNPDNLRYSFGFGAGTSISRREHVYNYDFYLQPQLSDVVLRGKLAAVAIENNNLNILKELKAREIPDYYMIHFSDPTYPLHDKLICKKFFTLDEESKKYTKDIHEYYNQDVMDNIAKASDEIIDYYTNPIIVPDTIKYKDGIARQYEYLYFYISKLLDVLIKNEHSFSEFALRKAIKYSENTYKLAKNQIKKNIDSIMNEYNFSDPEGEYAKSFMKSKIERIFDDFDFNYDESQNILRVKAYNYEEPGYTNVVRNLIYVSANSKDIRINCLIDELNELYNKIINIKNEFTDEDE